MKSFLKLNKIYLILLTALVLLVYVNSLGNAFLSDDLPEIVNNPNLGNIGYVFKHYFPGFIRPLLYWVAFQINGLNPVIFRLTNILLHLGNIYLLYWIISQLVSKRVAFFAAAIFAVHSLLSEPIVWISGGGYPQYTFFFLLSFLFYIRSTAKNSSFAYLLSPVFYLLSFMSHPQMPSSLVLVYPIYELIFGNLRKYWTKCIPFVLILLVFFAVNFAHLSERENTLQSVHYQDKGVDNIFVLVPVAVSSYINLIFYPKDLTLYHSELALSQTGFIVVVSEFLIFLGIMIYAFIKSRQMFFWLSLFFISLFPTLTPFRLNWIVAERYVYLGSIGIFVPAVYLLDKLLFKRKSSFFYTLLMLILLMLSARTFIRNIDWKNEDNLWIATGKTSPSSPNTHNNLGDVYGRLGNKQASIAEFKRAIELKPNYADAFHNLGNAYRDNGQLDLAMENYQKAANINPNLWQSYQNIAAIYFQNKQYDKALENMGKAIQVNPGNIQLRNNLGITYLISGQKDKAKEIFQLILSNDPQNQFARQGLTQANK